MTLAATTISDIVLSADEHDLERIIQAVKDRRNTLSAARASSVQVGMQARTTGLTPKYLNGLTGVVERGNTSLPGRMAIRLDEGSTDQLRWKGRKFFIPVGEKNYLLDGIPTQCFVAA